ncbi:MAG: CdaR family protein [Anaerolineales bacterium]
MKQKLRSLGGNIFSLLLAAILAVAVWMNAVSTEDPDETRILSAPLSIEVSGLKEGLVAQGYESVGVQVTFRAPHSVWDQLVPENVHAQLDLTGKSEGEFSVPVRIQTDISPVLVESVEPAKVDILIDRLALRSMAVRVQQAGNLAPGFQAGTPAVSPESVSVSGPESVVDRIAQIVATVNVEGVRSAMDQSVELIPLDTEGTVVTGVTIDPASVSVSVPVQQLGGYRDLVVKVPLLGAVKSGYRLTGLTINPQVVTLYSDNPDVIRALPGYVETQPLDISGASADITKSLSLVLPEGVQVVGDPLIVVQVSISAIEDSITISRPIRFQGLEPGLSVTLSPAFVDVILSGPAPVIWSLKPADIDVFLDLTGKDAGTYKLTPEVNMPAGLKLVILSPEQVEVVIIKATVTPTP